MILAILTFLCDCISRKLLRGLPLIYLESSHGDCPRLSVSEAPTGIARDYREAVIFIFAWRTWWLLIVQIVGVDCWCRLLVYQ